MKGLYRTSGLHQVIFNRTNYKFSLIKILILNRVKQQKNLAGQKLDSLIIVKFRNRLLKIIKKEVKEGYENYDSWRR